MTARLLELYCGIGGCAAALGPGVEVAAAVDINRKALAAYRHNFDHPTEARTIESIRGADLERWDADVWWLSPPCQPFTRRGLGRDDRDPRSASLLHLIDLLGQAPPRGLALENVPGFAGSRTHARLREALERLGYEVRERQICPSELGVPNRRRRFYLLASRDPLLDPAPPDRPRRQLAEYLDPTRPELAQLPGQHLLEATRALRQVARTGRVHLGSH